MELEGVARSNLAAVIANRLRDMVVGGQLKPGDRLPGHRALARTFHVSVSSVREAISALTAVGVLETRHGRGTYVSGPSRVGASTSDWLGLNADTVATRELVETQPITPIDLDYLPHLPPKTNYRIGVIGAGFIVRDVQLAAYQKAGFTVTAIASRTPAHARSVAAQWGIARVHDSYRELLADPEIQVVDLAFPPDLQLEVVQEAIKHTDHLRGILAQKPLALNTHQAREIVDLCADAGLPLAVNQNMRYDQSMRALKGLLERGVLGTPVLATIEMRARPHWQAFLETYDRLTFLNMSVHHLDIFRFLFGDPERVLASARTDPRTSFAHTDGITCYILEYPDGLRATAFDDTFTWSDDAGIRWRVEGTDGIAKGTIGWPDFPRGSPSTIDYTCRAEPGVWHRPRWEERWFPDAFVGTMGQLMRAIQEGTEPEISGRDNLRTMTLVDACYQSVAEHRAVRVISPGATPTHAHRGGSNPTRQ